MKCKNCEARRLCLDNPHVRCELWGRKSEATQSEISQIVNSVLKKAYAGRKSNNFKLA